MTSSKICEVRSITVGIGVAPEPMSVSALILVVSTHSIPVALTPGFWLAAAVEPRSGMVAGFDLATAGAPHNRVPPARLIPRLVANTATAVGLPHGWRLDVGTETPQQCWRRHSARLGSWQTYVDTWHASDWPSVLKTRDLGRHISTVVGLMRKVPPARIDGDDFEGLTRDLARRLIDGRNLTESVGKPPLRRWVESKTFAYIRSRNSR